MTFRNVYKSNTTGYAIMQQIQYEYVYCWQGKMIFPQYNIQVCGKKEGTFGDNCEWRMTKKFSDSVK